MKQLNNIKLLALSGLAVLLFYIITQKVYTSGFSYGDDYRIMVMNAPENVSESYKASCHNQLLDLKGSLKFDSEIGRFRPLSWVFVKAQTILFNNSTSAYRFFNLLTLFFTSFFFLKLLAQLKISTPISILCLSLLIFGVNAESWWSLIPPQQNIGELFLIVAIYSLLFGINENKKKYFILGLSFAFLSSFVKESFAVMVPFVLSYFYLQNSTYKKQLKYALIFSLIPIILICITTIKAGGAYGYESNTSIGNTMATNLLQLSLASLFFIAPLSIFLSQKNKITVTLLFIVALGTQLLLLYKIKIDEQHHYLSPAIIIIILITANGLQLLKTNKLNYYRTGFVLYSMFVLYNIKNTFINSQYYAIKLLTFHQLFDEITKNDADQFVYVNHSGEENDLMRGFSVHLSQRKPSASLVHFYKNKTATSFYPIISNINDSIKKVLFFELPNEKGIINYDIKQLNDSVTFSINKTEYKLKGKFISFINRYNDIGLKDLFRFNFTNTKELTYNAVLLN